MKKTLCITLILLTSFATNAKVLDRIVAVYNDKIITLSQIRRAISNLQARRQISQLIYSKPKMSQKEMLSIFINKYLIRSKLETIGYVVSDDRVEAQVKDTEKKLNLSRAALLNFLKNYNMTYDEYFELVRETMENNLFNERVIRPLISITDQEIKNKFYNENVSNKALSFKYTLVDFTLEPSRVNKYVKKNLVAWLEDFQNKGVMAKEIKTVETNVIEDIKEDGLEKKLQNILKKTNEGEFSKPIFINGLYHVFFVKKKDLVDSDLFMENKNRIRFQLYKKASDKVSKLWFSRESNKHYIKYF